MISAAGHAVRIFLIMVGLAGICWSGWVIPYFHIEHRLDALASQIIEGRLFSSSVMDEVERQLEGIEPERLRPAALAKAMIFHLRQVDDAIHSGSVAAVETKRKVLDRSILLELSNVPGDAFAWLALFWRAKQRRLVEGLSYLTKSYVFGSNEGWIAIKRNRLALSFYDELTEDLQSSAVDEFCRLTNGNLVRDAASILANEGRPRRDILLACVPGIPKEEILKELSRKGLHIPSQAGKLGARPWD